jgi:hypothetical protein
VTNIRDEREFLKNFVRPRFVQNVFRFAGHFDVMDVTDIQTPSGSPMLGTFGRFDVQMIRYRPILVLR